MSDVPKIVQDRLRAATPREGHPNADVLTAFAEHALSGGEREDVVRHLARCGDCREVVALSIPPSVEAARQPEAAVDETSGRRTADRSRGWFAWPNLRWAAMAAGVIVVASVVMLRPGKKPEPTDATVNYPAENKVQTPSADAPAKFGAASASLTEQSRLSVAGTAKPEKSLLRKEPATVSDEALPERAQARTAAPPASLADGKRADLSGDKRSYSLGNNQPMQKPAAPEVSAGIGGVAPEKIGRVTESVEVSGANAEIQTAPAEGKLIADEIRALPIEKAKQATKEEGRLKSQVSESAAQKKLVGAYLSDSAVTLQKQGLKKSDGIDKDAAPQWSLAEGKLQRSLDAGATWQVVLQLQHPLLAYGARGIDIWAGGQAGTLFHSADSGATWAMIQPSTKAGTLAGDIVGIDVRGPAEIVLTTRNNESWTTADSGKTWEKK